MSFQIDPEVLKELPPQIRDQIETEIKTRKSKQQLRNEPMHVTSEDAPGCSHWSSLGTETANENTRKPSATNDAIVPLPSPSQVTEHSEVILLISGHASMVQFDHFYIDLECY